MEKTAYVKVTNQTSVPKKRWRKDTMLYILCIVSLVGKWSILPTMQLQAQRKR